MDSWWVVSSHMMEMMMATHSREKDRTDGQSPDSGPGLRFIWLQVRLLQGRQFETGENALFAPPDFCS